MRTVQYANQLRSILRPTRTEVCNEDDECMRFCLPISDSRCRWQLHNRGNFPLDPSRPGFVYPKQYSQFNR